MIFERENEPRRFMDAANSCSHHSPASYVFVPRVVYGQVKWTVSSKSYKSSFLDFMPLG